MFEALTERLNAVFSRIGSKGVLTEKDVDEALREVRLALLEADVNFRVVRDFISGVKERAIGVDLFRSVSPGQQVVKLVNDELIRILSHGDHKLAPGSHAPAVLMMVGLQGSGKTTTAAKLASHLKQSGHSSLMVAADLRRPAAIEQLVTLGKQLDIPVYQDGISSSVVKVCVDGIKRAHEQGAAWAILDTGGRLLIVDELMAELEELKEAVSPAEILLVVDSMTGQDAVKAAGEFNQRLGLTGLVLTKLDGDARGGAALSITAVTGVPIKFMGVGERIDALEAFFPDRLASRILGMGDILTLVEKAQATFDQTQQKEMERKLRSATFDLEDFLSQLQQLKKMGPISQVLGMIPGMSSLKGRLDTEELDDTHLKKVEAIIYSMTAEERSRPEIIKGKRRLRISMGSGTTPQDVNQLLNQFRQAQKMMRQMAQGRGPRGLQRMMR